MTKEEGHPSVLTDTILSQDETERRAAERADAPEKDRGQLRYLTEPQSFTLGSCFRGIGGALLGAFIGALPWSIASIVFPNLDCLLGILIGMGAFFGYKICKGIRRTGFAFTVILLCTMFFICLTEYAGCFFRVWGILMETLKSESTTLIGTGFFKVVATCASTTTAVMFDAEMVGSVLSDLAIGLAAGILGILLIRKYIVAYVNGNAAPVAACDVPAVHAVDTDSRPERTV